MSSLLAGLINTSNVPDCQSELVRSSSLENSVTSPLRPQLNKVLDVSALRDNYRQPNQGVENEVYLDYPNNLIQSKYHRSRVFAANTENTECTNKQKTQKKNYDNLFVLQSFNEIELELNQSVNAELLNTNTTTSYKTPKSITSIYTATDNIQSKTTPSYMDSISSSNGLQNYATLFNKNDHTEVNRSLSTAPSIHKNASQLSTVADPFSSSFTYEEEKNSESSLVVPLIEDRPETLSCKKYIEDVSYKLKAINNTSLEDNPFKKELDTNSVRINIMNNGNTNATLEHPPLTPKNTYRESFKNELLCTKQSFFGNLKKIVFLTVVEMYLIFIICINYIKSKSKQITRLVSNHQ